MSDNLPLEIVEEILHRLPGKSVVKCTSVCRAWNSLIKGQTFICDHLGHAIQAPDRNSSLLFQLYIKNYTHQADIYSLYSVNRQTDHFSVERFPLSHLFQRDYDTLFAGTCNGLVCSADYSALDSTTIVIWNPLLGKYVVLPKPITTYKKHDLPNRHKYDLCYGLGFDSRNNDYMVVRLMNNFHTQDTPHVEVYSLASGFWRSITVRVPQFHRSVHEWLPPVFLNGALHWVVRRRTGCGLSYNFILSFDVIKETFGELTLPKQSKEEALISNLLAVEGGNSLAVVNHLRKRVFCIWVMKQYGITHSWTEVFHCHKRHYGGISRILALSSSGKVVMTLVGGATVLVDPINELVESVGNQLYSEAYVSSYTESLFFLNKEPDVLSF